MASGYSRTHRREAEAAAGAVRERRLSRTDGGPGTRGEMTPEQHAEACRSMSEQCLGIREALTLYPSGRQELEKAYGTVRKWREDAGKCRERLEKLTEDCIVQGEDPDTDGRVTRMRRRLRTSVLFMRDAQEQLSGLKQLYPETADRLERYGAAAAKRDEEALLAFSSAADCSTVNDAEDLLRARGFYRHQGDSPLAADERVSLHGMCTETAVRCGEQLERFFGRYPQLKGILDGFRSTDFREDGSVPEEYRGCTAYCRGTAVMMNTRFFSEPAALDERFAGELALGWVPPVPDRSYTAVRETARAAEIMLNTIRHQGEPRLSDRALEAARKAVFGDFAGPEADQAVRRYMSGLAADNPGCRPQPDGTAAEDSSYGANTEFYADAMGEALCSPAPREAAQAALQVTDQFIRERVRR